jgi:hypothetical protein
VSWKAGGRAIGGGQQAAARVGRAAGGAVRASSGRSGAGGESRRRPEWRARTWRPVEWPGAVAGVEWPGAAAEKAGARAAAGKAGAGKEKEEERKKTTVRLKS